MYMAGQQIEAIRSKSMGEQYAAREMDQAFETFAQLIEIALISVRDTTSISLTPNRTREEIMQLINFDVAMKVVPLYIETIIKIMRSASTNSVSELLISLDTTLRYFHRQIESLLAYFYQGTTSVDATGYKVYKSPISASSEQITSFREVLIGSLVAVTVISTLTQRVNPFAYSAQNQYRDVLAQCNKCQAEWTRILANTRITA